MAITLGKKPIIPKLGNKSCLGVYLGNTRVWPSDKLINTASVSRDTFSTVLASDSHFIFVKVIGNSNHSVEFTIYDKDLNLKKVIYLNNAFIATNNRLNIKYSFTVFNNAVYFYTISGSTAKLMKIDLTAADLYATSVSTITFSGAVKNVTVSSNEDHLYFTVYSTSAIYTNVYNSSDTLISYSGTKGVIETAKLKLSIGVYYLNLVFTKTAYKIELLNSSLGLIKSISVKTVTSAYEPPISNIGKVQYNDDLYGYAFNENAFNTDYYYVIVSSGSPELSKTKNSAVNSITMSSYIYLSGGRLMFEVNKNSINAIYFNNVTETTFNAGITSFSVGSRILNNNDNQCYAGGAFFFNLTNGNCNVYA